MKTIAPILALGLIVAAAIGGFFYGRITPAPSPQQLTLEQIQEVIAYQQSMKKELIIPAPRTDAAILKASVIPFGFLPLDH